MLSSAAALLDELFEHPERGFPAVQDIMDCELSVLPSVASYGVLGLKKVEMICRPGAMTDCQAMAKGFGEIGLGCLYRIIYGFASCEMSGDG